MTSMTDGARLISVGVDTHSDVHVAAIVDASGAVVARRSFPVSTRGYVALASWAESLGDVVTIGIEGTGTYGAGLARFLSDYGLAVVEVDRPDRRTRRRRGKSDTIDAEVAARAALGGVATTTPKTRDGDVEMIRILRVARRGAMKARIAAADQLHGLVQSAPEELRVPLRRPKTTKALAHVCAAFRGGSLTSPTAATKAALRSVARRFESLQQELDALDAELKRLVTRVAPQMLALPCVGVETAGQLLVTAGDNPERLKSESSFASLCGVSPLPPSSGRTDRHRLNRGGDRRANNALWRITLVRMQWHEPTKAYVERRTKQGLTKREIMRCLKRYVAREVYEHLIAVTPQKEVDDQ